MISEKQYQQLLGVRSSFDDYLKSTQSSEGLNLKRDQSLARAAEVAGMTLEVVIKHISRLGIPVIDQSDEEVEADMDTLEVLRQSIEAGDASGDSEMTVADAHLRARKELRLRD